MKHMYYDKFKIFLRKEIFEYIEKIKLTNEAAAELLGISPRAYYLLKNGKNTFSLCTFIFYLVFICPDVEEFITKIRNFMTKEGKCGIFF